MFRARFCKRTDDRGYVRRFQWPVWDDECSRLSSAPAPLFSNVLRGGSGGEHAERKRPAKDGNRGSEERVDEPIRTSQSNRHCQSRKLPGLTFTNNRTVWCYGFTRMPQARGTGRKELRTCYEAATRTRRRATCFGDLVSRPTFLPDPATTCECLLATLRVLLRYTGWKKKGAHEETKIKYSRDLFLFLVFFFFFFFWLFSPLRWSSVREGRMISRVVAIFFFFLEENFVVEVHLARELFHWKILSRVVIRTVCM